MLELAWQVERWARRGAGAVGERRLRRCDRAGRLELDGGRDLTARHPAEDLADGGDRRAIVGCLRHHRLHELGELDGE